MFALDRISSWGPQDKVVVTDSKVNFGIQNGIESLLNLNVTKLLDTDVQVTR